MSKKQKKPPKREKTEKAPHRQTPTFLLELPLEVNAGQAKRIRGHLEAGRQLYNAVLSEGQRRLRRMRADQAWQAARALPRTRKQERAAAFRALREHYGFSEYALHECAKGARQTWIAEHVDAVLAQTLATRAYHALNRVCGRSQTRALQKPGTGTVQRREQTQRYRPALCAAKARGGQPGHSHLERRSARRNHRLE
jgi:hypothetical protein